MTKREQFFGFAGLLFLTPVITHANALWFFDAGHSMVFLFFIALCIEFFFLKWLFKTSYKKALYYLVTANVLSMLVGFFLLDIFSNVIAFIGFALKNVFNLSDQFTEGFIWSMFPFYMGMVSALLELGAIKLIWKEKATNERFFLMWGLNMLTISMVTIFFIATDF
jgi:hypothetical protein